MLQGMLYIKNSANCTKKMTKNRDNHKVALPIYALSLSFLQNC